MNWNDPKTWLLLIKVALPVGLIGWVLFRSLRAGKVFECPACKSKVSRDHIRFNEIECPSCGWRIVHPSQLRQPRPSSSDAVPLHDQNCGACDRTLETTESVNLWDGRAYCKECVVNQSPLLWQEALAKPRLEESPTHSLGAIGLRMFVFLYGGIMAMFGSFVFYAGVNAGGVLGGLEYLAWAQLFFVPFVAVFAGANTLGYSMNCPTVSAEGGEITVRQGSTKSHRHPIDSYSWFLGDASKTNLAMMPSGSAVVLALPLESGEHQKYVAVGYTEQSRQVWRGFLTLAGCPRKVDWERHTPRWFGAANIVLGILAIPLSIGGCFLAAALVGRAILWLTGDRDMAAAIGMQFLFPGGIFAMAYLFLYLPHGGMSGGEVERTPEETQKIERKYVRNLMIFGLGMGVMYLMIWEMAIHGRILAAGLAVVTTVFFAPRIGRRTARRF